MDIIGKDGNTEPQIHRDGYERSPKFESDREVRILKENGEWGLSTISKVKAGDMFRILAIPATGFIAGNDNEYVIEEYQAIMDACIGSNGAWEVDCFVWEDEKSNG